MESMNWDKLLNKERPHGEIEDLIPKFKNKREIVDSLNYPFEFDYFTASSCSVVRAMQDKTQVFAFSSSKFVRTRLTHSIEVASIAKSIITMIDRYVNYFLQEEKEIKTIREIRDKFLEKKDEIASIVATAGLLHDVGNPPFGHKGEECLSEIIKTWLDKKNLVPNEEKRNDLIKVEGNAQTLRYLISENSIKEMKVINPTYAVLSCLMKYTDNTSKESSSVQLHKKGFYLSEEKTVKEIFSTLEISHEGTVFARNPLAFILEAADDIAYRTADFEDAFVKELIVQNTIKDALVKLNKSKENTNKDNFYYCIKNFQNLNTELEKKVTYQEKIVTVHTWITQLKLQLIYGATWSFCTNYKEIMNGEFKHSLLEDENCFHKSTMETLGELMKHCVYNCQEVELQDNQAEKILDRLWVYLTEFIKFGSSEDLKEDSFYKLPIHLQENLNCLSQDQSLADEDFVYNETRLVIDFICSLTDENARELANAFSNIEELG